MDARILLKAGAELWVFMTELSTFRRAEGETELHVLTAATCVLESYDLEWFRDSLSALWLVPFGFLF